MCGNCIGQRCYPTYPLDEVLRVQAFVSVELLLRDGRQHRLVRPLRRTVRRVQRLRRQRVRDRRHPLQSCTIRVNSSTMLDARQILISTTAPKACKHDWDGIKLPIKHLGFSLTCNGEASPAPPAGGAGGAAGGIGGGAKTAGLVPRGRVSSGFEVTGGSGRPSGFLTSSASSCLAAAAIFCCSLVSSCW